MINWRILEVSLLMTRSWGERKYIEGGEAQGLRVQCARFESTAASFKVEKLIKGGS
jgi:hypothetical protein